MTRRTTLHLVSPAAAGAAALTAWAGGPRASQNKTSFFLTSVNPASGVGLLTDRR
ncbi:hypothetical protein SRS16CHR_01265 [Variovorax sp. SRS16]|uniref:hypothetical protein n=1 Tax=Variovorax sp. SRS16 TaxID=282217 RepID=UPI0013191500|nr:hypothetical protein [Variovorax sp. SRS16]VTU14793.1 hypothetical protein SRS16CHR_01265 [Variovorax sp. SRS16]